VKVVLDTNVLVSALLSPFGPPARVLDLALSGDVTLAYDDRIMAEYRAVLTRPRFGFNQEDVAALLAFVRDEGQATVAANWPRSMPDDDDVAFVEVAASAEATLITGNTRHFPPDVANPVAVMTPAEFMALRQWVQ